MYKKYEYDCKEVGFTISAPFHSYDENHIRQQAKKLLAFGSTERVRHEVEENVVTLAWVPKTTLDYFKQLVTAFEPSLNFGWLTPEVKPLKHVIETQVTNTYVNVIPLEPSPHNQERIEMIKMSPFVPMGACDWLESVPCIPSEVDREVAQFNSAERMAMHRYYN